MNSGLRSETRDLRGFYDSVRTRASGVNSSEGRQEVLSDLYEQFFKKALKKEADRLGIAYTPIPLVDFVLHSVNDVLQEEFGKSISDEGVHILDPFTGTGTFIVQLLQSTLIQPEDLERKYREELHANEILLLAYYIASVNIEEAFRGQRGGDSDYEPFKGIILTDTFNLNKNKEKANLFSLEEQRMVENNERAEHQQNFQSRSSSVIPPWSAWQKECWQTTIQTWRYPEIRGTRQRDIRRSRVNASLKNSLYDTYKMAIRWASDRIQDSRDQLPLLLLLHGLTGTLMLGIRACLPEEFNAIYILNLLGDARIYGESIGQYAKEKGVFGSATQSPVAITILIKNQNTTSTCFWDLLYREIGGHSQTRGES